jgi:predicted RNase H-like HicB family nuclease
MEYEVKVHHDEEGYAVWCPGLPGCWSQGETEAEALENIKDAIKEYLLAIREFYKNEETRRVEVFA